MRIAKLIFHCVAASATVTVLGAQATGNIVPDALSCSTCSVRTLKVLSLGDSDGPGEFVKFPSGVARDGQGRIWVIGSDAPKVFAADGRFIQQIGAKGKGPGEFSFPTALVTLPGDSMLIVDGGLRRGTVIGPDLLPRRMMLFRDVSPRPAVVIKWPSVVWGNGPITTTDGVGYPLHQMSLDSNEARVLRSFGAGDGQLRAGGFDAISQHIAPPRGKSVWTANKLSYQLTHWDISGARIGQLSRTPEWFATQSSPWMGNSKTPPPPLVSAVYEDNAGLVWVFVNVASQHWADAWASVRDSKAIEFSATRIELEKLYVTIVEVIDPRARRVVARTTLDSWVGGVLPDGSAWSITNDPDGTRRVRIAALTLDRGTTK